MAAFSALCVFLSTFSNCFQKFGDLLSIITNLSNLTTCESRIGFIKFVWFYHIVKKSLYASTFTLTATTSARGLILYCTLFDCFSDSARTLQQADVHAEPLSGGAVVDRDEVDADGRGAAAGADGVLVVAARGEGAAARGATAARLQAGASHDPVPAAAGRARHVHAHVRQPQQAVRSRALHTVAMLFRIYKTAQS